MKAQTTPKPTNLNMLFQQLVPNFVHLITTEEQTKEQFLQSIEKTYDTGNPRTSMFYQSCQRSEFETIRLNRERTTVYFNQ